MVGNRTGLQARSMWVKIPLAPPVNGVGSSVVRAGGCEPPSAGVQFPSFAPVYELRNGAVPDWEWGGLQIRWATGVGFDSHPHLH